MLKSYVSKPVAAELSRFAYLGNGYPEASACMDSGAAYS